MPAISNVFLLPIFITITGARNIDSNNNPFVWIEQWKAAGYYEVDHRDLLVPHSGAYVSIDGYHMGIGGDDSWTPNVHQEFLLTDKHYTYQLRLKR